MGVMKQTNKHNRRRSHVPIFLLPAPEAKETKGQGPPLLNPSDFPRNAALFVLLSFSFLQQYQYHKVAIGGLIINGSKKQKMRRWALAGELEWASDWEFRREADSFLVKGTGGGGINRKVIFTFKLPKAGTHPKYKLEREKEVKGENVI